MEERELTPRERMMADGPVRRTILKMSVSTTIGMVVIAIYNIVDAYFIGLLNDNNALAAISIALPLTMITSAFGLMVGIPSSTLLSRTLGEKNYKRGGEIVSTSICVAVIFSLCYTVFCLIFLTPILYLIGATDAIMEYCIIYARWMVISALFVILNQTMNNTTRGEGRTDISMRAMLLGAVLNIILDPIFIFVLDLGLNGAALATVIGQACSTMFLAQFYLRKKSIIKITVKNFNFDSEYRQNLFGIGIPVFIQQALASLSFSLLNNAGKPFGEDVIAAMGTTFRIYAFATYIFNGYFQAFQPFVAYNFGARNFKRVKASIKFSILYPTVLTLIIGSIFISFPTEIMGIMVSDENITKLAANNLVALSITLPFVAFIFMSTRLFQALGRKTEGFILSVLRQGVFYIPLIYLLPIYAASGPDTLSFYRTILPYPMEDGLYGVMSAQSISDVLTFVIAFILFLKLYTKLIRHLEENPKEENAISE